jgi:hypothetical protein
MSKQHEQEEQKEWEARARVAEHGEQLLGRVQWFLFSCYGKCMSGPPYSGLYVSGMPFAEVHRLLDALAGGETIPVHLMHRHRSGHYQRSSLSLRQGVLMMVYADRELPAV